MGIEIIALLSAVLGPLVAYVVATRRLSGKIATSEASDLWAESKSIRDEYARRIHDLTEALKVCEARIDKLDELNKGLYLENGNLKRMVGEHEKTISELREVVHRMREDNDSLRADNTKLRDRVTELEGNGRL